MPEPTTFNLQFILDTLRKYRWYLLGLIATAGLLAVVMTMPAFYPPEYRATSVIFPANSERFDGLNLFADDPRLFLFGDNKGVERLQEVATSEAVMLRVMDSLNLWQVYGIDKSTDPSPKYKANRFWGGYVSIVKAGGNGLRISALDQDPGRAADIVNCIAHETDRRMCEMTNANREGMLRMYNKSLEQLYFKQQQYEDSARSLRKRYSIFNDQAQTEVLIEKVLEAQVDLAQARAQNAGVKAAEARLEAVTRNKAGMPVNLENFQEGIDKVMAMGELSIRLARDIKELQEKIAYVERMSFADFSTVLQVEKALPADRKAKPIRWLVLATTLFAALIVAVPGVLLIELLSGAKTKVAG